MRKQTRKQRENLETLQKLREEVFDSELPQKYRSELVKTLFRITNEMEEQYHYGKEEK